MKSEKEALAVVWSHKRFLFLHALADALWTALALGWFWLPDSKTWGVVVAIIGAPLLLAAAAWLIRTALMFYERAHAAGCVCLQSLIKRPRFLIDAVFLAAVGIFVPYRLIGWHPQLSGLATQTISLAIRFSIAFLLAVTSGLVFASLLAAAPAKSSPAQ